MSWKRRTCILGAVALFLCTSVLWADKKPPTGNDVGQRLNAIEAGRQHILSTTAASLHKTTGEPRGGGDTCDTATVIAVLPYTDTGNTCGFADDYDEACTWTATAPDVAYEYTPAAGIWVDISLCNAGTDYDTKLFVYEGACPGTLVACADDSCPGYISEIIGLELTGGNTYYIIVDGYGSNCGNYELTVVEGVAPPDPVECPPGSLFSQPAVNYDSDPWAAVTSDEVPGYIVYENFSGISGDICDIHWWGQTGYSDGYYWYECDRTPDTYNIRFWQDDGTGQPDLTTPVCEYLNVAPNKVDTGHTIDGWVNWEYSLDLVPCCTMTAGWVSIEGVDAGHSCWFMWLNSETGDGVSYQWNGSSLVQNTYNMGLCLTGTYVPSYGACCDDSTGDCTPDVEAQDCPPPLRFVADTACEDLDPPCGEVVGACCHPDGTCDLTTEVDCTDNWLGAWTTCDECPCIVPCPDGAVDELEVCGEDTNGGCNSEPAVFEPMTCGVPVCGTTWADGGTTTRDTDWYEVTTTGETQLTLTVEGDFTPVIFGFIEQYVPGVPGCDNITGYISPYLSINECEKDSVTMCVPAGTYYVFVGSSYYEYVDCPAMYTAVVTCEPCTLPRGACCLENGDCVPDQTEAECLAQLGTWQGEGVSCDPNPCPQPEPGDNCGLPLTVTLPADLPYTDISQYTCGRNNNYSETCLGSYDGGEDIIYELIVTDPVDIEITLDPKGTTWTGITLDDSCPPDATCIATSSTSGSSPHSLPCKHLEPGTYYVMVDTYPSPDCIPDFDLTINTCTLPTGACCVGTDCVATTTEDDCINTYGGEWYEGEDCATFECPSTEGNNCGTPLQVTLGLADLPFTDNNSNCGRGNDYDDPSTAHCLYYYDSGEDMIYELIVTEAMDVTITLDPHGTTYPGIAIGDMCPPTDSCIAADYHSSSAPLVIGAYPDCMHLEPGTYYIQVDTWASPTCIPEFDLTIAACTVPTGACCVGTDCVATTTEDDCINTYGGEWYEGEDCATFECPSPEGDNCGTPLQVTLGLADLPFTDNNSNCGRGDDYDDPSTAHCLYFYDSGEDMIYELIVTEAMDVTITLDPHGTTYPGIAIGDMCPPTDSCIAADYHSSSAPLVIGAAPDCLHLEPGTYYIQVDTWSTPDCIPEFDLTIEACESCEEDTITLILDCDSYGSETTWEIIDLDTATVMCSGGPYSGYEHVEVDCCIPYAACYGVYIYDSYGDGGPDYEVYLSGTLVASGTVTGYGGVVTTVGGGCPCGDLDSDGDVDGDDYTIFLGAFGACDPDPAYLAEADFNDDGCVGIADYQAWVQCFRDANPGEPLPGKRPMLRSIGAGSQQGPSGSGPIGPPRP
ncbi:MAG: hypothetical protein KKB50_13480 [Planctomycetes bacterium]|nr:hypothetical protein [Planctomycetota bacterium]